MATTALDIAQAALRRIGVLAAGETADAASVADAIRTMSDMLAAWEMEGIKLGPLTDQELAPATTIPLPSPQIEAVKLNLAVRLAGEYGRTVDPATAALAQRGMRMLQAAYLSMPRVRLDPAIVRGSRPHFDYPVTE